MCYRFTVLLLAVLIWVKGSSTFAAPPEFNLRMKDGGYGQGVILNSPSADRLNWQNEGFDSGFEFDVQAIESLRRVVEPGHEMPPDEPRVNLAVDFADDSHIVGRLVSIHPDSITIESQMIGEVSLQRSQIRQIRRVGQGGNLIQSGFTDDRVWSSIDELPKWKNEGGYLAASESMAGAWGNVKLPSRSHIQLTLAWSEKPYFVIGIGAEELRPNTPLEELACEAKLEVWDKQLVLVRETKDHAEIAIVAELAKESSRFEISVYLDTDNGIVAVSEASSSDVHTIKLPNPDAKSGPNIYLLNLGKSLSATRFELREWDGVIPERISQNATVVEAGDGTIYSGSISGFDAATSELIVELSEGGEKRLAIDELSVGDLSPIEPTEEEPTASESDAGESPVANDSETSTSDASTDSMKVQDANDDAWVDILLIDRSRLRGRLCESDEKTLCVEAIGVDGTFNLSPESLLSLYGNKSKYIVDATLPRTGTLHLANTRLDGYLLPTSPEGSRTSLHWNPVASSNACEVSESANGHISRVSSSRRFAVRSGDRPVAEPEAGGDGLMVPFLNLFRVETPKPRVATPPKRKKPEDGFEIRFRTGDTILGTVERIDETGISFQSSQTSTTFAEHEQIDSVWFTKKRSQGQSNSSEKERLLTVPRSMKNDPPTHLFVSVTGDNLRGRLERLENGLLTIEVRSDVHEIPTSQLAQIVWLHQRDWNTKSDKVEDAKAQAEATEEAEPIDGQPFYVHAVTGSEYGFTFTPTSMVDDVLMGHSELLGDSSVKLDEMKQLLFGRNIEERVAGLSKSGMKLSLAPYPRVYREDGTKELSPGGMHPLVGKPAPDFTIKTIDGKKFQLSANRDRIVVLDFWASWCGPCMQTMPSVEQIVDEIGSEHVQLVAVNIQESSTKAQIAIDRLRLTCNVLLDEDGQTAAVYDANAIPQTVIIDRQGNVTHLFVGGGAKFLDDFRNALTAALTESAAESLPVEK